MSGSKYGVAVDHDEDLVRACAMPVLSAAALPPLGWRISRTSGSLAARRARGVVGRAVVDDDHLDRRR